MNRFNKLLPDFLKERPRLLFFALVAVGASGFGQTFFVSVFGGELRSALELSHTGYGSLYSAATVVSALLLLRFGSLVDSWTLPWVSVFSILILATGCLTIANADNLYLLGLGFLCVRFGGQGMISHTGSTTAARYFSIHRGKALAFAGAGFPISEAILPPVAVVLAGYAGWRWVWLSGSILLMTVILPVLILLAWGSPAPANTQAGEVDFGSQRQFSRREVLRDPGFFQILPATLMTPFVVTAAFFHQVALARQLGWSLELVAAAFPVYAACHLASLVAGGPITDRFSAGRALPFSLIPMAAGLLVLGFVPGKIAAYLYMGLVGVTQGLCGAAVGAVWAERYGIRHLGAIRAMNQSMMVFSTAVAPVLLGYLLDRGFTTAVLATSLAILVLAGALMAGFARPIAVDRASVQGS